MSTQLLERPTLTDPKPEMDEPKVAHLIGGLNAGSQVTEAYVMGTPITALCGRVFVPSRDPQKLPLCRECRDLVEAAGGEVRP